MPTGWLLFIIILSFGINSFLRKITVGYISPITDQFISCIISLSLLPVYYNLLKVKPQELVYDSKGIYISVLTCIVGQIGTMSFLYAAQRQGIGMLTGTIGAYPIVTILLSITLLGESFSNQRLVGISLAIIGMLLVQSK